MKKQLSFLVLVALVLILTACGTNTTETDSDESDEDLSQEEGQDGGEGEKKDSSTVTVDVKNNKDESVGKADLQEDSDGVKVSFEGKNLPKGVHAFHVHEKAVCETPDFESAGGHFNPKDSEHGFENSKGPHAGDMPNLLVGEDGTVEQSFLVKGVTLDENKDESLIDGDGTSLVIHEGVDDNKSQPAGDAGDRLACGVIEK